MKPLILAAVLILSSVTCSCTSSVAQQVQVAEASGASDPVAEHLGYTLGNWAVRPYVDGKLAEEPVGIATYRSLFGGMVLEETRAYEWTRQFSPKGEAEIRWYLFDVEQQSWRNFAVLPRSYTGHGEFRQTAEGFRGVVTRPGPNWTGRKPPERGVFLLTRATEKGPFEAYDEDDPDRPLIWWTRVWLGFRGEIANEMAPVGFLERTPMGALPHRPELVSVVRHDGWSQFDFWLGEWDLQWQGGAGTNTIESVNGGWTIREEFAATDGSGFTGGSLSAYEPIENIWRQYWMDSSGAYLSFVGAWDGDQMVLKLTNPHETPNPDRDSRMRWHDIEEDSFVWTYEGSEDHGATWTILWEINYTRRY